MKKRLLLLIIVLCACIFSGCGASKTIDESKKLLDQFYASFSAEDIQTITLTMHDSLIKDLGGEEYTQNRIMARRALLGDVKDYNIENTAFESLNGVTEVELTVNTEYGSGESYEEVFTFLTTDDRLYITGIDMPKEKNVDDMAEAFFSSLDDSKTISSLYIPLLVDAQLETNLNALCQRIHKAGDTFAGYTLENQQFDYQILGENEAAFVYIGTYALKFGVMDFACVLQMSVQDGKLGLNNVEITPSDALQMCENYFSAISKADEKEAANLYSQIFYDETPGGKEGWITNFLSPICHNYGSLINYDITDWDTGETEGPNGSTVDTVSLKIISEYENIQLEEFIVFNCDKILAHSINEIQ